MRWALIVLLLVACGRRDEQGTAVVQAADPATVDAVAADLLERLEQAYAEDGPQFTARLPDLKDEAAHDAGYQNWKQFKESLRLSNPARETSLSLQITRRMQELLKQPARPEENETE